MMKKRTLFLAVSLSAILASCVSKKKYTELEGNLDETKSELMQTRVEKEDLENQMEQIEMRVERYNNKIASLSTEKEGMMVQVPNESLVLSEKNKAAMRKTLKDVPAAKLAGAKSLKDSLNIAIAHNISKNMGESVGDLNVSIEETMVKINIDDNLLFGDSSFRVGSDADEILSRIAEVVKSEPSLEVLVEGHTDSRTVKKDSYIVDNWDLSARRSAAIVRRLEDKFGVASEQLIVAGRSSYDPLVPNSTKDNMAKNRRTQIVIMPNLDKFFAMLGDD
ncbi:OmpA family protein [Psychroflexus gondwanensis]|jgi:chemotaxis protein MotB|uniref:Peptidoglycan-binding lipoprotein ion transport porin, OmpA family n=1 Tax=Psychroflexus gondwanensis ACAM 44 TaxID=1189619 RepID=N1WK21_9FLAO|nr:OmpA family protein [Psychroflexus gondwanensis]EMY80576.1 peptidoglycan-binding lipoprotein ion transport porin, OmpA family [Psychroflexus gondwanensis ACAM 44]TXE20511.1 OmpA family protein [Psychroflexus gondwanensis]